VYTFVYDGPRPYAFFSYAQDHLSSMTLHVRTEAGAGPIAPQIRRLVRELDPDVAAQGMRSMEEVVRSNTFGARFITGLASLFSGVGLLLAILGVYGLLAIQVAQQSKELGVRMALGAASRDVLMLVVGRGFRFAAIGCVIGIVLALGTGRWLGPLLYAIHPLDPMTYVAAPALLMGTVVLASLLPARRATRIDPTALMRDE
jgi:putative ABC transport system permease protein